MPFPGTVQSGGSRIDVTTLTPFNSESATLASTGGVLIPLISITGKGFLDSFYAITTVSAATQIRVTIDGVVKVYLGYAAASAFSLGVIGRSDLYPTATAGTLGLRGSEANTVTIPAPNAYKPFPTTDGSNGMIYLGDAKLYFYNSLTLEILTNAVTKYRYSGAFKS